MQHHDARPHPSSGFLPLTAFWLYVGAPLAWGVMATVQKAMALFA